MTLSDIEIRRNQIYNHEKIKIEGSKIEGTRTIFVQNAGFMKSDRFCFYCYDEDEKNPVLLYLTRLNMRCLVERGTLN